MGEPEEGWITTAQKRIYTPNVGKTSRKGFRYNHEGKLEPQCYNCGRWGHWLHDCKEPTFCYECKGNGHIARKCRVWLDKVVTNKDPVLQAATYVREIGPKRDEGRGVGFTSGDEKIEQTLEIEIIPSELTGKKKKKEELKTTILAEVLRGNPIEKEMMEACKAGWSRSWIWDIHRLDDKRFIIPCSMLDQSERLLRAKVMNKVNFAVRFESWSLAVGEWQRDKEWVSSYWITIYNFPLPCWNYDGFKVLLSEVGRVDEIAEETLQFKRLAGARVKVSLPSGEELPDVIRVKYKNSWFIVSLVVEKFIERSQRRWNWWAEEETFVEKEDDTPQPMDLIGVNLDRCFASGSRAGHVDCALVQSSQMADREEGGWGTGAL